MCNAKNEFIEHIEPRSVLCAKISYGNGYGLDEKDVILKVGYSIDDYATFLNAINFEYEDGYGIQELHGIIWYQDGTWSDRGEYDGSEWWQYHECPRIPNELKDGE